MTMPAWVADALAADLRAAADEMGSADLRARAGALVGDAAKLAAAVSAAMDTASGLPALAERPLSGRPAIPLTTASRRLQASNRAALAALLGELAAIRLAEVSATASWTDRSAAGDARDLVSEALDARAAAASDEVFAALRRLRGDALDAIAAKLSALPSIVRATPGRIVSSLVLAYDWYGDLDRASDIAARAGGLKPGFLPARPIAVLSS